MSYGELFKHRQTLDAHIKRTKVLELAQEYSGKRAKCILSGEITPDIVRGYFISPEAVEKTKFKNAADGHNLIVVARGNNRCWQRLVVIKEAMHLFDDDIESTMTAEEFGSLLAEFRLPQHLDRSAEMRSEIKSFWMALGLFCRERDRAAFATKRANGTMTDEEIADKIKMPKQHVPDLCGPDYSHIINTLCQIK